MPIPSIVISAPLARLLACAIALVVCVGLPGDRAGGPALAADPPAAGVPADAAAEFFRTSVARCFGSAGASPAIRAKSPRAVCRWSMPAGRWPAAKAAPRSCPASPTKACSSSTSRAASRKCPRTPRTLSADEVAALRRWVAAGAVLARRTWNCATSERSTRTGGRCCRVCLPCPLPRPARSTPRGRATPVDAFILARLRAKGLRPAPAADRRTLIRRLYFDLVGLPPAPDEVDAFAADPRPAGLRTAGRSTARLAPVWRALGPALARRGALRRNARLRQGPAPPQRLALSRLRHPCLQPRQALRPFRRRSRWPATCSFPAPATAIEAPGLLAAGPWDFIGHAEVPETTRSTARSPGISTATTWSPTRIGTFVSLTVQLCPAATTTSSIRSRRKIITACRPCLPRSIGPTSRYDADRRRAAVTRRAREPPAELKAEIAAARGQDRRTDWPARSWRKSTGRSRPPGKAGTAATRARVRLSQPDLRRRRREQMGAGRPGQAQARSRGSCYVAATTISTGSAPASASRRGIKVEIADDPEFSETSAWLSTARAADVPNPGTEPQRSARRQAGPIRPRDGHQACSAAERLHFALAELDVSTRRARTWPCTSR